jgi:CubicO group peptidase (beta-lactamase class C family)
MRFILFVLSMLLSPTIFSQGNLEKKLTDISDYLQPYVKSANFAGTVLVELNGKIIFEKSYGFADQGHAIKNGLQSGFHIASISMQFTAAAILRLVDDGKIRLDEHIADFVPQLEGADSITVRDLLNERSGLPDINGMTQYGEVLKHHQTPESLVEKISGRPILFTPGSKFLHEEHSAYNVLALIIEKETGLPFSEAIKELVFKPLKMMHSWADDDSVQVNSNVALGYAPENTYGLRIAQEIHWSAKAGNASIVTTANDYACWIRSLLAGDALSRGSTAAALDTGISIGFGWFKRMSNRFGELAYYMNGRAPGFSSFALILPGSRITIILFSNIYSSATTSIGNDIAAIVKGLPYERFNANSIRLNLAGLELCRGTFQFGKDFYQPDARIILQRCGQDLVMIWPSGDTTALIPQSKDRFIDRAYWVPVLIRRNEGGYPTNLMYDRFTGASQKITDFTGF